MGGKRGVLEAIVQLYYSKQLIVSVLLYEGGRQRKDKEATQRGRLGGRQSWQGGQQDRETRRGVVPC